MATPIAFMTYGWATEVGKAMGKYVKAHAELYHTPINIEELMHRDPGKKKKYKTSSHVESNVLSTQLSLLEDKTFFPAVVHIVSKVIDEVEKEGLITRVLPICCSGGLHLSHGVANAAVNRVLNHVTDVLGNRKFNAKLFQCTMVNPETVHDIVGGQAVKWLCSPFETADASEWGKKASREHERAYLQINWMSSLVVVLSDDKEDSEQEDINPRTLEPFKIIHDDTEVKDVQLKQGKTREAERSRSPMRKTSTAATGESSTEMTRSPRQKTSSETTVRSSTEMTPQPRKYCPVCLGFGWGYDRSQGAKA